MNKIKTFFKWLTKLIVTPLKAIVNIPVSDRFIGFMNKHVWLKILISGVIATLTMIFIYIIRG